MGMRVYPAYERAPGRRIAMSMLMGLLAACTALAQPHTQVADAQAEFDAGLAAFDSDPDQAIVHLQSAAEMFEAIIRDGAHNGRLYYNLGNTYLQLGRLGEAIASYRRAEQLIPGDARLEANLQYAMGLRRTQLNAADSAGLLHTLFFWHYRVPLATRFRVGLGLYVLFWAVLMVRVLRGRGGMRVLSVLLAAGWLAMAASVTTEWPQDARSVAGVIVADDVVVRKGNGVNYEPQFQQLLYEGVEFTVLERRGQWLRIELPNGYTGWIRTEQAELITPLPSHERL